MASLVTARYGKDNVRLYKVQRDDKTGVHTVTETTVCCLLEGNIETSYTKADNSVIVATDSIKNTIYVIAKQNPVTPSELFGSILSSHFVNTYPHIHAAHVKIVTHKWTRMMVDGKLHPHSFVRDGTETRNVDVTYRRNIGFSIASGMQGLLVLKSTGSAFHGFLRDEFTTLPDVYDRIMSTEIDAIWEWDPFKTLEDVRQSVPKFDPAFDAVRSISLAIFAKDQSASVQATMYKMAEQILAQVESVKNVTYSLPNKHYFEIDLSWHKGLKNTGYDAEVYAPQSGPNGLIKCTVSRSSPTSKL